MSRQIPRLVLVLATAFLAGCVSDPFVPTTVEEPREHAESAASDAPENEPASTHAGEPEPANQEPVPTTNEARDPEPAMEEQASPTMTSVNVTFEGRTPAQVCRGHPYGSSFACVIKTSSENTTVPLEGLATPLYIQGTLTWDAATPSNGHLVVQLMVHNGNEYVYSDGPWGGRQFGESPLPVSFDLSKYAGHKVALAIRNDECMLETGPAFNCAFAGSGAVDVRQEFAFKGQLSGWD